MKFFAPSYIFVVSFANFFFARACQMQGDTKVVACNGWLILGIQKECKMCFKSLRLRRHYEPEPGPLAEVPKKFCF